MKPVRVLLADHMRNDRPVISRIPRGQVFLERGPVFAPTLFEEAPTTTAPYVVRNPLSMTNKLVMVPLQ
jgi:hypothetical protein